MAGHGHEPGHGHHGDIGEDYNIGTIVTVAVIGCLLCVLVIIWIRALYVRSVRWEWERKTVALPAAELVEQKGEQVMRLNSYEWTDPARGYVSIPVGDAMAPALARLRDEQARQASLLPPAQLPPDNAANKDDAATKEEPQAVVVQGADAGGEVEQVGHDASGGGDSEDHGDAEAE